MNIENQNYKILVSTQQEAEEIQKIFFACGFKWAWQRYAEQREVRLGFFIKTFYKSRSLVETTCTDHKEITLPELREFFKKSPWGQIESLKAQLAQQSDDYVLVPKRPTSQMLKNGDDALQGAMIRNTRSQDRLESMPLAVYIAMLKAGVKP